MINIVWLFVLSLRRQPVVRLVATTVKSTAGSGRQTGGADQPKDFIQA